MTTIQGSIFGRGAVHPPPRRPASPGRRPYIRLRLLIATALTAGVAVVAPTAAPVALAVTDPDPDFEIIGSDVEFILDQIRISEFHAQAWLGDPTASPL